jgi:hypothetical protein
MNFKVYSDKNCQVEAFSLSIGDSCKSKPGIEVEASCFQGKITALPCDEEKWSVINLAESSASKSTACMPFADNLKDSLVKIYTNQACVEDDWSPVHLGNEGGEIPVGQPKPSNVPVMISKSQGLIIVIAVCSLLGIGLITLLVWYFLVRRVKFRRKPLQDCLLKPSPSALLTANNQDLEGVNIKVVIILIVRLCLYRN